MDKITVLSSKRHALLLRLLKKEGVNIPETKILGRRKDTKALLLSCAQQRLWFLNQLAPDSSFYNIPAAVRLTGPLSAPALEQALNEIARRHEVLRTTFPAVNGQPFQAITPHCPFRLPVVDLTALPETDREAQAQRIVSMEAQRPFDLSFGPLLRVGILRLAEQEHILHLNVHHIVFDGKSIGVFFREFEILYAAFLVGKASPLAELPVQYADYALWQRDWFQGQLLERQLDYWKKRLAGAPPVLDLPTDYQRPQVQSYRGALKTFHLPAELCESVRALSRGERVTTFMTLLATWVLLLSFYTEQEDIVLGTDIAGRNRAEFEELIGLFANQLVLRTDLSGNPSFRELLNRVRVMTLGAYAHQDLPFEQLVKELKPKRELGRSPLFQIKFMLENEPAEPLALEGLGRKHVTAETGAAKFDVLLTIFSWKRTLHGSLEYNTDIFEAGRITRIVGEFGLLLGYVVENPEVTLHTFKEKLEQARKRQFLDKAAQLKASRHQRHKHVRLS
jgi:hypothetical protein